jgi:putative RNA 2'-phosphotransferase
VNADHARLSKRLSYVLRHGPQSVGLDLDSGGWAVIEALLAALERDGRPVTRGEIEEVVRTSDKRRFALSEDGLRIRARQGHSIPVDLGLRPVEPPHLLYHGTTRRHLESIRVQGLLKGARHHVHLSLDVSTARKVGGRRGKPAVLTIEAWRMHADGREFYVSENEVWLTDDVPPEYIRE